MIKFNEIVNIFKVLDSNFKEEQEVIKNILLKM